MTHRWAAVHVRYFADGGVVADEYVAILEHLS